MFHVKPADVFGDRLELAEKYHDLLATDGSTRGFIGPREVPRLWERHILNCAVAQEAIPPGVTVADVGSGAGLPGIPLAIARPDLKIILIEPLLKRSVFLGEVVEKLGLDNVTVIRGRAEEKAVRAQVGLVDVVTSRAVAPLGRLAGWSLPLVKKGGRMIALKGSSVAEELQRDAKEVKKAGGGLAEIRIVGRAHLEEPTTLIIVPRIK
ncbi:16S rRNA (guanine(527)-N(7))-methyltransferase RsmG [Corynebacterium hindlerae]|uniref:16S rRNA (guanine(527)-N(7))-methyltransferase RsmG n=1 Tax=Corynebacterium hindlerae TaxID=699041 RepID=UPI003AAD104D